MSWHSPFVVLRISDQASIEEVFSTDDLKKAKYWLTYIAQPGDLLCRTPAHPKHSGKTKTPEYWQHKEPSGQPSSEQVRWLEFAKRKNVDPTKLPEQQKAEAQQG